MSLLHHAEPTTTLQPSKSIIKNNGIASNSKPSLSISRVRSRTSQILTADAIEYARRQRQFETLVLNQIYARALRLRAHANSTIDNETPLSLVELMQASQYVFKKHNIQEPDDAIFHRHLLYLTAYPEANWKRKVQRLMDLQQPFEPRVCCASIERERERVNASVQSMTETPAITPKGGNRRSSLNGGFTSSIANEQQQQEPSTAPPPIRRTSSMVTPVLRHRSPTASSMRRERELRLHIPVGDTTTSAGVPITTPRCQGPRRRNSVEISSPKSIAVEQQKAESSTSRTPLQPHSSVIRHRSPTASSLRREREQSSRLPIDRFQNHLLTPSHPLSLTKQHQLHMHQHTVEQVKTMSKVDATRGPQSPFKPFAQSNSPSRLQVQQAFNEEQCGSSQIRSPTRYSQDIRSIQNSKHYDRDRRHIGSMSFTTPHSIPIVEFKRLVMCFQQWKEIHTMQRLVRAHEMRECRVMQSMMTPIATHTLFHWILLTLLDSSPRVTIASTLLSSIQRRLTPIYPSILRTFTQKWSIWQLHRMLQAWARHTRRIALFRMRLMIQRRTVVVEMAYRCLQRWRQATSITRRQQVVVKRMNHRQKQQYWKSWRQLYYHALQWNTACSFYRRKQLTNVYTAWTRIVQQRDSVRMWKSRVLMHRVIRQWRIYVKHRRSKQERIQMAHNHLRIVLLCWTWKRWRLGTLYARRHRLCILRWMDRARIRKTLVIWNAWKVYYQYHSVLGKKETRFKSRSDLRLLRQLMQKWSSHVARKHTIALLLMEALNTRTQRILVCGWIGWKERFDEITGQDRSKTNLIRCRQTRSVWIKWKQVTRMRVVWNKLDQFITMFNVKEVMERWKRFHHRIAQYRANIILSQSRQEEHTKQIVFKALLWPVQRAIKVRENFDAYMRRHKRAQQSKVWRQWLSFSSHRLRMRTRDCRVEEKIILMKRKHLWNHWRLQLYYQHLSKSVVEAASDRWRQRCFRAWQTFRWIKHARHAKIKRVAGKVQQHRTRQAITYWSRHCSRAKQYQHCVAQIHANRSEYNLKTAWVAWLHAHHKAQTRQLQLSKVILTWQHIKLSNCFQAWQQMYTVRRQHRKIVRMWMMATQEKTMEQRFRAWQKWTRTKHVQKSISTRVRRRLLHQSVRLWYEHTRKSRTKTEILRQCINHWKRCKQEQRFFLWKEYTSHRHERRSARALATYHAQMALYHRYLDIWIKFYHYRERVRAHFHAVVHTLNGQQVKRAIVRLYRHAQHQKQVKQIMFVLVSNTERGTLMRCFQNWQCYRQRSIQLRKRAATALVCMKQWRMSQRLHEWQRCIRMRQVIQHHWVQALSKSQTTILTQIFKRWCQYTQQRRFYHILHQRAVVFQVFCIVPTAFETWKNWMIQKQEKRQIVAQVIQRLTHLREGRAWKAWNAYVERQRVHKHAVFLWTHQSLTKAFQQWRAYLNVTQHKKQNKSIAQKWFHDHLLHKIIHQWQIQIQKYQLLRKWAIRWRAQTTFACFTRWIQVIERSKRVKKALHQNQHKVLRHLMTAWKDLITHEMVRSHQIKQRFLMLWQQNVHQTTFQRWKTCTQQRLQLKQKIVERMQAISIVVFKRWCRYIVQLHLEKQRATKVRALNQTYSLCKVWKTWKKRELLLREVQWRRQKQFQELLRQSFQGWQWVVSIYRNQEETRVQQIAAIHQQFVCDWLAHKVKTRVEIIQHCENILRPQHQSRRLGLVMIRWKQFHANRQCARALVMNFQQRLQKLGISELVTVCIKRWRATIAFRVFIQWYVHASNQRSKRIQHNRVLIHWMTNQTQRYFKIWNQRTRKRLLYRRVLQLGLYHRLVRMWRAWIHFKDRQIHTKTVARGIVNRWQHRITIVLLTAWKDMTQRARLLRDILQTAHATRNLRISYVCLHTWKQYHMQKVCNRMQTTIACVTAQLALQRQMFRRWLVYHLEIRAHQYELQRHMERLQVLELCSSFRAWKDYTHRQQRYCLVEFLLVTRRETTSIQRFWDAWSVYTGVRTKLRQTAEMFNRNRNLRRAIHHLRHLVIIKHRRVKIKACARAFLVLCQNNLVQTRFDQWKELTRRNKKHGLALTYHKWRIQLKCWQGWCGANHERQAKQRQLQKAVMAWRMTQTRRAWLSMMLYTAISKRKRVAMKKSEKYFLHSMLRTFLRQWQHHTLRNNRARQFLAQWQMQTTQRVFEKWKRFVLKQKTLRVCTTIISTLSTKVRDTTLCCLYWGQWRLEYAVVTADRRQRQRRAWARWRHFLMLHKMTDQQHSQLAYWRIQHILLHRWRTKVVHSKLHRAMCLVSLRFSNTYYLQRSFREWKSIYRDRKRQNAVMRHIVACMQHRQIASSFYALASYCHHQQEKRVQYRVATKYAKARILRSYFSAWRQIRLRRLKITQYLRILQNNRQYQYLKLWRDVTVKRRQQKKIVVLFLQENAQRSIRSVWTQWGNWMKYKRNKCLAEELAIKHSKQYVLRKWRHFVACSKGTRMMIQSLTKRLRTCWCTWSRIIMITKRYRAFITVRKKLECYRVLIAWHRRAYVEAKCKRILSYIMVSTTLESCLARWKQYTSRNIRLRRLVHGHATEEPRASTSISTSVRLARHARCFQQFVIVWDLNTAWKYWRNLFHARLFYRMRRIHMCWTAWRTWSKHRHYRRYRLQLAHYHHLSRVQRVVLSAWHKVIVTVHKIQRERLRERELLVIIHTEMLRQERKRLQRHWQAWKQWSSESRALHESLQTYVRMRVLTKSWLIWTHDFVQQQRQVRALAMQRMVAMDRFYKQRVVHRLYLFQQQMCEYSKVSHKIAERRCQRITQAIWRKWRDFVTFSCKWAIFQQERNRRRRKCAINQWKGWCQTRQEQRLVLEAFTARQKDTRRKKSWVQWLCYTHHRRLKRNQMIDALAFFLHRCIYRKWYQNFTQVCQTRRLEAAKIQDHLLRLHHHHMVQRWYQYAHSFRLRRVLRRFLLQKFWRVWKVETQLVVADRLRDFQQYQRMKRRLQEWRQIARQRSQWRHVVLCAHRHQNLKCQSYVLSQWQTLVQTKHQKRIARSHYESSLCHKWLWRWNDVTIHFRTMRMEWMCVAEACDKIFTRRKALFRWKRGVQQQQHCRAVLLSSVVKIVSLSNTQILRVIVRAWHRVALHAQVAQAITDQRQRRQQQQVIRLWVQWLLSYREQKRLVNHATIYHQQRLISIVFFHWQNVALSWNDVTRTKQKFTIESKPLDNRDEEHELSYRRPLSPMQKRDAKRMANYPQSTQIVPNISLPEVASLSLGVKKRLMMLGKWKPSHTSISHV